MPKGTQYASERKFITDERTGIKITKLTAFPTMHTNFYMHDNCFTADSKTVVFRSLIAADRRSPSYIFKVNVDGMGLTQVSDEEIPMHAPIVSYADSKLYYTGNGLLSRVDLDTLKTEDICALPGEIASPQCDQGSMTFDGKYFFAHCVLKDGAHGIVRLSTDGGPGDIIYRRNGVFSHTQCEPSEGKQVAIQAPAEIPDCIITIVDVGGGARPLHQPYSTGHWMWHGSTKRIMTSLNIGYPGKFGITIMGEQDSEPEVIEDKLSCWHSGSSRDGKWVISDTNWPDVGMYIHNTDTKKSALLCYSDSSSCGPQWTHPHPGFSPDGKIVVFCSDKDGYPNVYLAFIPDEMREKLSK